MKDQNNYLASLETCRRIAKEEYTTIQRYFKQCDAIIDELSKKLQRVIEHGSRTLSRDKMVADGLTDMMHSLQRDYGKLLSKRNANLEKQQRSLDCFNVMLFGRTMAGKSTVREAITRGDGQTIGKGAQRTTRDVQEYEWNNLRIIDTPGFGAYNGQEDTQVAHEILEQSDVVLFMLNSDSIQESTFVELEHVHKLNKPLIFVLNMKKDLENEGNRRRALKNPEKYIFKEDEIQGHTERLKNLTSRVGINPGAVRIIPIHAQAAFLATTVPGEEGSQLHELSRIDHVLNALIKEVEGNGPIRRVQTFLDSSLHHVDEQSLLILRQRDQLSMLLPQYESGLTRISQWKMKTLRDAPRLLSRAVDLAFKPLIASVADFVDDHIETDNAASAWDRHYKSLNITKNIEKSVQDLAEQVMEELQDFNREMNEGLDITLSFEVSHNGKNFSESDFKRINGWGSAIAGVVSAIAFFNSWNPVGWVAVGISIVFTVFSLFSDSRAKKLKEAKSEQRQALLEDIEESKKKIKSNLVDWFEMNIHRAYIIPVENNLSHLCQALNKFINEMDEAESQLGTLKHEINFRLLNRVAHIITKQHRDLCFKQGRAGEIMIVINKFESDSADKETKISGITQVLEPKIPEDFPIVFTDAQSFFDALDEDDEQERQELLALSNAEGLTKAIDSFVAQRGLYARLTTPLQQLQVRLESKIDELTISDPLQKGLVSLLTQNKRVFLANRRDLTKKVGAHLDTLNSQIVEQGNQLADALGGEQEAFEKMQDSAIYECERLINSTLEALRGTVDECLSDLEAELVELANTPASAKINEALLTAKNFNPEAEQGKVGSVSNDDPFKLNSAINQGIVKSAEKGFSFLAKSAIGDASKTGLKSISGSSLHNAIKEIGGFFGYKFKAWEAVKIAEKIGKGAKFLGPAMAIFGVGMQIYDDYQQSEHAKKILQIKRDIRKNFKEYSEAVRESMDTQLKKVHEMGFDLPITNIDEALHEIRSQVEGKSDSANALRAQLDEVKNLREEIQGAF